MRDVTPQITASRNESRLKRFGTAVDNAIFAVAPSWGEKRLAARMKRDLIDRNRERLGHPTMHQSEHRDHRFISTRQSTDEQLNEDLQSMQHRSREMVTTNPHAAGAIEGRVSHEIGVGLACRPEILPVDGITEQVAKDSNAKLSEICREWSDHGVDRQRQFSLAAMQRIAQRTYAGYGEVFLLLREAPFHGPIGLTLEIVNPLRCETPPKFASDENVKLGIRYHARTKQIIGYYFRKVDRLHRSRWTSEYEFIRRYDAQGMQRVCHVFEPIQPDQSRGIPWLMASVPFLKDTDDFHEAELINKQIEACLGVIIKGGKHAGAPSDVAEGNAVGLDSGGNQLEELYPAMVHYADNDGDIQVIDPSRPGGNFAPFIEASLRAVASSANYPYELLAKNFFRTTYSSGRLAMLDGKLGFDMRRDVLIQMGCKPLWRRLVSDAFFHGQMEGVARQVSYLANRRLWERHSWGGESFGAVDPEKEIKAHEIGLETNQETLAMIAAEKNRDWRDLLKQRDTELRTEIEFSVKREQFERDLREKANLPMPGEREESNDVRDPELQGAAA